MEENGNCCLMLVGYQVAQRTSNLEQRSPDTDTTQPDKSIKANDIENPKLGLSSMISQNNENSNIYVNYGPLEFYLTAWL
ncbi:Uncharacterized protein TCM_005550 [Theobroma cacao]|uniref:Uncharacterized protein n=1 Tax=Theobroma cacao TaxID=3641 RepID=A0A061DV57_THECC|nr:Uncharacterized protein TCM_005550 [Theobroma cacao]